MEERTALLKKEWSDENKNPFESYTFGSKFKAKWSHYCVCGKKHDWEAQIGNRYAGTNCPYCSRKTGKLCYCKSLEFLRPDLALEWDYEKNDLKPSEISSGSHKKVWWKCKENHVWLTKIYHRVVSGSNCPYCCNQKICPDGSNSLEFLRPDLVVEWDYEKNKLGPGQYSPFSHKKAWWRCAKGHKWSAMISNRANGRNCSFCKINKGEFKIKEILDQKNIEHVIQQRISWKNCKSLYFDFYISEKRMAIEFDGVQHFKPVNFFGGEKQFLQQSRNDLYKKEYCEYNNIGLIRIHYLDLEEIPKIIDEIYSGRFNFNFNYTLLCGDYPDNFPSNQFK